MIVFAHLLNDHSGSTRVLRSVMDGVGTRASNLLFVGGGAGGLLDDANGEVRPYRYRRAGNRLLTLLTYLASQARLFFALLRDRRIDRDAVVYVNTLMPFGAALYGWVTRRTVIYHVHELTIQPRALRTVLTVVARITAARLIYVSDAHRELLPIAPERAITIHNAVEPSLLRAAARQRERGGERPGPLVVLMLSYYRAYKGVPEFLALAERLSMRGDLRFHLVLSDGLREAKAATRSNNVRLFPPTCRPEEHYAGAGLVVNLSRPDLCVETFGLTLLEAMAFGVPVIAPPVGGPAELVRNGREGWLIDSRDGEALAAAVTRVVDDPGLRRTTSVAARSRAAAFGVDRFHAAINGVLNGLGRP